ncbi:MAG: hypothetical protein KXJ50_06690 [Vulcanococcus sp.]|nr:hypothetical protein [Vulcanococcus sp.]MBW0173996.1 hypothetical protein [Vulcanococcus sp.]MBW0180738.1 hypothetical protein [Vulcanococcus sp.]
MLGWFGQLRLMRRSSLFSAALLSAVLLGSIASPLLAHARGGGGGGGFHGGGGGGRGWGGAGGGGRSWGGGNYHFQNNDWQRGYQGDHPMYGAGTRDSFNNDRVNVNNNFYRRDYNGWNDNWRNGGYWNSRPWNHGWYNGWGGWGWWGANAAAWGVAGLATGAAITGLVDAASENSSPVIVVPNTSYELNYGSVEGVGSYGVSFNYNVDGSSLMGAANCQQGLLNGQVPGTSDQAQLLNAVCQVAYGSGS